MGGPLFSARSPDGLVARPPHPDGRGAFLLVALGLDTRSRRRLFALIATLFQPPDGITSALIVAARVFRTVLAPDVFLRQFALAIVLHIFLSIRRYLRRSIRFSRFRLGSDRDWNALDTATSYEEWSRAALAIDSSSPAVVAWKADPRSPYFTQEKVLARIEDLARYRHETNVYELMYTLRSRQYRTQFNIGRAELYAHSLIGTKAMLEEYLDATIHALHFVKEMGMSGLPSNDGLVISQRDVLAFMNETRHAYGRTALHLSGGAALGVHHLGVLKAMMELKMLPRILSGTSAGSIIAAIAGVRTNLELERLLFSDHELADLVSSHTFFEHMLPSGLPSAGGAASGRDGFGASPSSSSFGDGDAQQPPPRLGVWARLTRLLRSLLAPRGPVLNVETLGETIRELVGDCTFLQAFNATGRILNIMVSRSDGREPMLLNYLTAPHVLVWSACRASSAVPGIFAPCELWARGPSGLAVALDELKFTDGCVDSDLPKARLTELFNINFFIVSQVNPAATLLSTKAVGESGIASGGLTAALLRLLRAEVSSYIRTLNEISVGSLPFKTTLSRVFNVMVQEYDGDLNLYPAYPIRDLLHMIDNPTPEYLRVAMLRGQRAVWTRASQLRALCRIEFEMDAICHEMQASVAASIPISLSASRRPSTEHMNGLSASGARGLKRVGQIPSYNTLDMAAGIGVHHPPPPANAAAQAARKQLARSRFSSTPLGLRSSAGNLSDMPPITSVASYLSLAQAADFVPAEELKAGDYVRVSTERRSSFSDDGATP